MRFVITLFLFQLLGSVAHAGKIGVEVGAGLNSHIGLVGFGLRYFPNKHFDVFATTGVDIAGPISALGARVYSPPIGDRCWFVIPCTSLAYLGAFVGQVSDGTPTVTKAP